MEEGNIEKREFGKGNVNLIWKILVFLLLGILIGLLMYKPVFGYNI